MNGNNRTNNSEIELQENIPLTQEEIIELERGLNVIVKIATITIAISLVLLGVIAAISTTKENLNTLKYYDYFGFAMVGLLLFGFCYFIAWIDTASIIGERINLMEKIG